MSVQPRKCVIGLIGGIGSGKSAVAAELARHGAHVIQGDELGHEALHQPEVIHTLTNRWGGAILRPDGELDRRKIAAVVFADPGERRFLEGIVFPHIERRIREEIARGTADPDVRLIVLDAAVLLESGWGEHCDWVVYVDAPRSERLKRVRRRGWSEEEVRQRSAAQLPLTEKVTRANFVIDNSGTPDDLTRQVERLLRRPELQRRNLAPKP